MIVVSCEQVTKSFGVDIILDRISFSINSGNRIGVVGANGTGKSTLFKLILGHYPPDSGQIYKARDVSIGYLAQDTVLDSTKTVWDELMDVFTPLIETEKRLRNMENQMANYDKLEDYEYQQLLNEYANLREDFESQGGYSYQSFIRGVLTGLGFSPQEYHQPIYQLSGGQKTRIALAKLLLEKPGLLLLDEPTNHLDLDATQWLEDYLKEYPGTVMMISHDRYFLDKLCHGILEIENSKVHVFEGNYSSYVKKKDEFVAQQQKEYQLQQKEISRQQKIIQRFRSFNREKSIRAAESRQKALDKIERVEKVYVQEVIRLSFDINRPSGNDVLKADSLSMSFGDNPLFDNVSFSLQRGERAAIIGPNGCGKSTLLKIILGRLHQSSGTIELGTGITIGYYDQEQASLDSKKTIIEEIWDTFPKMTETEIRNALAGFLFKGDDVYKTIGTLSGGEKGRVLLTKLVLSKDNFLLLDEPTNHLDMASRECLEQALIHYPGTILVVSHDRYFLNKVVNRILVLNPQGIEEYMGNYDYYIEKKTNISSPPLPQNQEEITKTALREQRKKERAEREKLRIQKEELKKLEEEIQQLEQKLKNLEEIMCDPLLYNDVEKMKETHQEYEDTKAILNKVYSRWMELAE